MLELDSSFHSVALVMQFQPFSSAVDAPFWHLLKEKKIQELKLDDRPIPIWCSFTSASHESVPARLSAGSFSFDSTGVRFGRIPNLILKLPLPSSYILISVRPKTL
jgi:hypothetical protein